MKIIFCGASSEIGASCIFVNIDGKNILMDSGIRMTADPLPEFSSIQENGGIDCILVSHSHMDHTGSLPTISREYPSVPLYITHPTRDITRVLLYDSLKIMKYKETEIPVFAENNVLEMLGKIKCYNFNYPFKPFSDRDIKITFYPAGHIAGAACIYIQSKEGSIFYTGDFAVVPQRTVGGADIPKLRPDIMITESTYGDKLHSNRKTEEEKLIEIVKKVIERGGKILIPAFAVGRAQEVILILKSAINKKQLPPIPVYVDGMVKEICNIYKNYPNYLKNDLAKKIFREKEAFYSEDVKPVLSQEMRDQIVQRDEPCCIISSSGMLTGGYSVYYAQELAKNEKNYIAITGYQDEESPGRHLLELAEIPKDEEKFWKMADKSVRLACDFGKYNLSAHGDKGEILGLIEKLQPRKIFLIHGNPPILAHLSKEVQAQVSERRREIYIPKNGDEFDINFYNPRKQLEKSLTSSMEKYEWPEKENINELWEYLIGQERYSGYTVEELIYIWSGRKDFPEEIILSFQNDLNQCLYFEPEERRLFLFHPVSKENLPSENENIYMEGNKVLALTDNFFPEDSGLYKKGLRNEQKIILLYFNFPAVAVSQYSEKIKEIETVTGWKTESNTDCNLFALDYVIREKLDHEEPLILKTSYYKIQNKFKVELSQQPSEQNTLTKNFKEKTGIELELDYPGKLYISEEIPEAEKDIKALMSQESALSFIDMVFSKSNDKLYKKSIKQDQHGKYIELSFISPVIGEKYQDWIADLQTETGWRIRISQSSNQIEIIQKAISLLRNQQIIPKKNPSIIEAEKIARIKLANPVEEEKWKNLKKNFNDITGFKLEYIL